MTHTAGRARAAVLAGVATAALALASLAGCSSGSAGSTVPAAAATTAASVAAPGTAYGQRGALAVRGAYIPAPASPDVAVAYFDVANSAGSPDRIVSVSTPAAASAMLHENVTDGTVGSMRPLPDLVVPAHGTVALSPGGTHVMLLNPTRELRERQTVPLTITFAAAGALTLEVPVGAAIGPAHTMPGGMS